MEICFSWEKQVSVAPKDVYRPSIFFFPHHYPLALAVNKSLAVYILSPMLKGVRRENKGSVNRLLLGLGLREGGGVKNDVTSIMGRGGEEQ